MDRIRDTDFNLFAPPLDHPTQTIGHTDTDTHGVNMFDFFIWGRILAADWFPSRVDTPFLISFFALLVACKI